MTHSEKLQELIIDIREKLQRLNKPEKEDLIFYKGEVFNLRYNDDSDEADVELQHTNGKWIEFSICDFTEHLDAGEMILTCSPMLNDVLEWFGNLKFKTIHFEVSDEGAVFYRQKEIIPVDLSKPYLRDWGEELIDFLYNLIEA